MKNTDRAEAILTARHKKDQIEGDGAVGCFDAAAAVAELHAAGLLTPALPAGWRLADHEVYGRVIVTNTTPDSDGRVYFVFPDTYTLGYDWDSCPPDELTYIDTEPEEA